MGDDPDVKELEPFPFDDESDELEGGEGDENSPSSSNDPLELELETGRESSGGGGGGSGVSAAATNSVVGGMGSGGGWNAEDMLATNEAKYGYKSTYNSSLPEYTLAVERGEGVTDEEFRRRELEAERLAAEIESSASYRKNIDKELSDNEEEEAAFSAVVRGSEINNNNQQAVNNNSSSGHGNYQVIDSINVTWILIKRKEISN